MLTTLFDRFVWWLCWMILLIGGWIAIVSDFVWWSTCFAAVLVWMTAFCECVLDDTLTVMATMRGVNIFDRVWWLRLMAPVSRGSDGRTHTHTSHKKGYLSQLAVCLFYLCLFYLWGSRGSNCEVKWVTTVFEFHVRRLMCDDRSGDDTGTC